MDFSLFPKLFAKLKLSSQHFLRIDLSKKSFRNFSHWLQSESKNNLNIFYKYALFSNLSLIALSLFIWFFTKPVYRTELLLALPVNTEKSTSSLPGVGQTTQMIGSSGTGSSRYDPRSNYKYIFTQRVILDRAALIAGINPSSFGKPKIKNIINSTLMKVVVTDSNNSLSYKKAISFFDAVRERLDTLRRLEVDSRIDYTNSLVSRARNELSSSQQKLIRYKISNQIYNEKQPSELSQRLDNLLIKRAEIAATSSKIKNRFLRLSSDLNMTPSQAVQAVQLRGDSVFQELLSRYSKSQAEYNISISKFGSQHPRVNTLKLTIKEILDSLQDRSFIILDKKIDSSVLQRMILTKYIDGFDEIYQKLLLQHSEFSGSTAELERLDLEIEDLKILIKNLAEVQPGLTTLTRDVQLAEAFFASTISASNLIKTDSFSAYPLIQLVNQPTVPTKDSSQKTFIILLATLGSSVFLTSALYLRLVLRRQQPTMSEQ